MWSSSRHIPPVGQPEFGTLQQSVTGHPSGDEAGLSGSELHATPTTDETFIEPNDDGSFDSHEFDPEDWDVGDDEDRASGVSTSVTSSIYAHTYENGRRYHSYKHARYPVPNDDMEQNREDMKHSMMLEMTDGRLCYAPIGDNPQKIIDIGTGTGIWAIEAGDRYPSAAVMGLDLTPIQLLWTPPNVKFIIDDCEEDWLNGKDWDLVHLRAMSPILKDIPRMCRQSFDNIKPGGWMEWQEFHGWMQCDDGTMAQDDALNMYYKMADEAFFKLGFDIHRAARLGDDLRDAGFVNVQCVVKKVPVGVWARDKNLRLIGWYLRLAIQDFLPVIANRPLVALGLNEVERQVWRAAASKALENGNVHRYWNFYFWYGQKPI